MKTLILPVAGESSRFPKIRPKFLLTHPSGNTVLTEAIRGLNLKEFDKIVIIGLKEHQNKYGYVDNLKEELKDSYCDVEFFLLKNKTKNQPETVFKYLKEANIKGEIVIKDCDNYFELDECRGNFIGTYKLNNLKEVNAGNKSYIKFGKSGEIVNIVEKNIISNEFCCGVYGFQEASDFIKVYDRLKTLDNLYISHIIYQMILDGGVFFAKETKNYVDWGTLEDWQKFTSQYITLFLDIDGVLLENSGKICNPKWGTTKGIKENIELINKLYNSGKYFIVLTTTRTDNGFVEEELVSHLKKAGLRNWNRLVMGLPHSKRILINDYSNTNTYPTAISINLERNKGDLNGIL